MTKWKQFLEDVIKEANETLHYLIKKATLEEW